IESYLIKNSSVEESLLLLLFEINQMQKFNEFLSNISINDKLINRYLEFGAKKSKDWQPLWESVKEKIKVEQKEPTQLKHISNLFAEAEDLFNQGLGKMSYKLLKQSDESFDAAEKKIQELLQLTYGGNPILENLQKLVLFYQMANMQIPLQE